MTTILAEGSVGANPQVAFWHAGPTSYTPVTATAGTVPITGGDTVQAVEARMKALIWLSDGNADDGAFVVEAIPVSKSNQNGQPQSTYRLRWISRVTATVGGQAQTAGTEAVAATNLSAEVVRLLAIGF